ncbi:unnamed protein product [Clonostachys byssicola]|uniref:Uncharacterized protein n=1 Tax=Clonostachys byssicola TaxID=160290 RepID=A0A9N9Y9D3_9HYPO|nr:unnamed protein product [Clonostachys byssicola]
MRPVLLLSLGAALSLAAPTALVPSHGLQIDDSDLLKVREETTIHIDDSDLMKVRHVSSEPEQPSRPAHEGCILMHFFHAAPRYLSKSLGRIETVGANSRLLPVFWFNNKKTGEEDGQAPATSLEATDVSESKHGGDILYLADGEHQSWGRHNRHHRHHRHHRHRHPIIHTVMVWAHIISFLFLIGFTVIYLVSFVLSKTCDDSKESEEEKGQQRVLLDEKKALGLVEEV